MNIHNKAISKNNKTNAKNLQAIESIKPMEDNIIDTLINNYKQFKLYQKEKEEFENKYKTFTNENVKQ